MSTISTDTTNDPNVAIMLTAKIDPDLPTSSSRSLMGVARRGSRLLLTFSPTKLYDAVTVGMVTGIMTSRIRRMLNMMFMRSSSFLSPPMYCEPITVFSPESTKLMRLQLVTRVLLALLLSMTEPLILDETTVEFDI